VTSTTVSLISFGFIFGGSLAGIVLRSVLPERYFTNEGKDVLRLGLGLITTLSALVLGLLVSTAKSSYDAKRGQVTQIATDVILVDRSLELYGLETRSARRALRDQVAALIAQIDSLSARPIRRLRVFCVSEHLRGGGIVRVCPHGHHCGSSDSRYGSASYRVHETLHRTSPQRHGGNWQRALIFRVTNERGRARLTAAHRAAGGVAAGEQLDLGGHTIFPSGAGRRWRCTERDHSSGSIGRGTRNRT
jgi:hypothetical protein